MRKKLLAAGMALFLVLCSINESRAEAESIYNRCIRTLLQRVTRVTENPAVVVQRMAVFEPPIFAEGPVVLSEAQCRRKSGYELLSRDMLPIYQGEEMGVSEYLNKRYDRIVLVKHLDDVEREMFRIVVKDGKIYNAAGVLLAGNARSYIYVMDRSGNFYAAPGIQGYFHHSSFLSGGKVGGAGLMGIRKDGTLSWLTHHSGHYEPGLQQFISTIQELQRDGISLNSFESIPHNDPRLFDMIKKYNAQHLIDIDPNLPLPSPLQQIVEDLNQPIK